MLVGSYTKSIKEAQTYIQLLLVSASMPGYFLAVMDVKQAAFSVYIPTVSQYYLLNKFGRGEMVSATEIFQSSGTTLAVAALAVWGIIRLYRREGIVA
jgi:ABC-type Na+ efflux pump permease subunit